MGHFVTDELDRIELGDGEWVDIRRQMNYGQQVKLAASFSQPSMKFEGEELKVGAGTDKADLEMGSITLLTINIKAWSFKDDASKPIPVNEENIKRLDISTAKRIAKEISKRNPSPKA